MSKIKFWVARDRKGGALFVHSTMPDKSKHTWVSPGFFILPKGHPLGKGLTWKDEPRPVYLTSHSQEQINALVEAAQQASRIVDILKDLHDIHPNICNCWMCDEIPLELNRALRPFMEVEDGD